MRNPTRSMLRWLVENGLAPLKTSGGGIAHAAQEKRALKSQTAQCRVGCRVREIADALADEEGGGSGGPAADAGNVECPSRLFAPSAYLRLERGLMLRGNAPTAT
jgi:hypothetical protein